MEIGPIYFWTATISDWNWLLRSKVYKDIVINSLVHLSGKGLLDVFAFVIMPNHIHLIWRINAMNGGEMPSASLLKFTAHEFKRRLVPDELLKYKVQAANKEYEFWQRDSLPIELYDSKIAYQKLEYIHANPVAKDWNLVEDPVDYTYSSCRFYEEGSSRFSFLKHLGEEY